MVTVGMFYQRRVGAVFSDTYLRSLSSAYNESAEG